jgi:hypothetical protein
MSTRTRPLAALGAVGVLATGLGVAGAAAGASRARAPVAAASTCTTYFVASVRRGAHAGRDYAGVLTTRLDASGRFRGGSFVALQGGTVAVSGAAHGRGVSLSLRTGAGTLSGTGSVHGSLAYCVGTMQGRLRGPGRADRGSWLATTGQTLQLPGGVLLLTSAETNNKPNPQVLYKLPASGAATVYAGALNIAGNVDGQRQAARMNRPSGLGYDGDRSLVYVADVSNASIRRLDMNGGQVTTVLRSSDVVAAAHAAGYPAVSGWEPQGVAVVSGGSGALLIADVRNYVIWRYNPSTSQLKLYAGQPGLSGHADGSDTAVRFSAPQQITVSSDGLVAVVEPASQRLRLRDPGTGAWSTIGVCC